MNEERLFAHALAAIRRSMPLDAWGPLADAIAADRRKRQLGLAKATPDRSWFDLLEDLKAKGFAKLPMTLPAETLAEVRTYFDNNPVHKGPHIFSFDGRPKGLSEARADFPMMGYRFDQVVRAPHLVDIFNDPRLVDLIEAYLGCLPTLYSLAAWWSFPAAQPELIYSQYFHRDIDDWRFVTLFLYLTPVTSLSGPHQVIEGSHTIEGTKNLLAKAKAMNRDISKIDLAETFTFPNNMGEGFSGACEEAFRDSIFNATGPAGTIWMVNTMALHRGLMPETSPRLVVWARYGFGPSVNSVDLEQGPIARRLIPSTMEDTPRNRFVNRLLFDFDRGPFDY